MWLAESSAIHGNSIITVIPLGGSAADADQRELDDSPVRLIEVQCDQVVEHLQFREVLDSKLFRDCDHLASQSNSGAPPTSVLIVLHP